MTEPIDLLFGLCTQVGQRKHKLNHIHQVPPTCLLLSLIGNLTATGRKETDIICFSSLSFNLANFLFLLVVRAGTSCISQPKRDITLVTGDIFQCHAVTLLIGLLQLFLQFIYLLTSHLTMAMNQFHAAD